MNEVAVGPAGHVFVVIPVHNRRELTRECLTALRSQAYAERTIIVVDDGSSDGTGAMVRADFPEVRVLTGSGDRWWTGGVNLGVAWALAHAGAYDWVLTLNDDAAFDTMLIPRLVATGSRHPGSLVGAVDVSEGTDPVVLDGGVQVKWATAKFLAVGVGQRYADARTQHREPLAVDVLPGRGMLVPVEAFRRVGLFAEKALPHYGADYEFSVRAHRAGFRLLVDYSAAIVNRLPERAFGGLASRTTARGIARALFSRRSPLQLRVRLAFALRACPRRLLLSYVACDLSRTVANVLRPFRRGLW